jgi:CubicO group peptidase (beta-lactamase class C family)
MKRIQISIVCIFLLSVYFIACNRTEETPLSGRVKAGVAIPDSAINRLLERYRVPGVSIAVIIGGKIDWAKGYGVIESGKTAQVDTSTLFQAASISKPVSAVAALRMVKRGELSLDADVNQKLRSWKIPVSPFSKGRPITLRMLLSHSSGLSMHGVPEFPEGTTVSSLVDILDGKSSILQDSVRIVVEPGTVYRYSGGGYIVLQLLMTDVSGRSFESLAREYVLKPAGMRSSTFSQPLPASLHSRAAVGHLTSRKPIAGGWHTLPEQAAGGLWTTPTDLANFAIGLWKAYHEKSAKMLPQYLAREMLTRQIDNFGLGLYLPSAGTPRFSHGGGNGGYRCFFVMSIAEGNGLVIMTNGDAGEKVIDELIPAIGRAYRWFE